MENVAPLRALSRRSRQLLQFGFIVLAIGVFVTVISLAIGTIRLLPPSHPLYQLYTLGANILFWTGIIVLVIGIAMLIRALTRRRENDLALMTGDALVQSGYFDAHYTFIRNINRSGLGYIDAVLIGTPGVLVFRILNATGAYANEGANWLKQNAKQEWMPFRINPTRETVEDIQSVRQYLAKNKLSDVQVFGIIVFTAEEQDVQVFEKESVVPVTLLHSLVENLGKQYLTKTDRVTPQMVVAVRRLLLDEA
jgi:Nuclease-related domain